VNRPPFSLLGRTQDSQARINAGSQQIWSLLSEVAVDACPCEGGINLLWSYPSELFHFKSDVD
jgi:hypothetical protein